MPAIPAPVIAMSKLFPESVMSFPLPTVCEETLLP